MAKYSGPSLHRDHVLDDHVRDDHVRDDHVRDDLEYWAEKNRKTIRRDHFGGIDKPERARYHYEP